MKSLKKGKGEKLMTRFAGREAPGGVYYPETKHYLKVCKHPSAGRHPKTGEIGGIDVPVIQELGRRGCITLQVVLADGSGYFIPFAAFLEKGRTVSWNDRRFPARMYCPAAFWHRNETELLHAIQEAEIEAQKAAEEKRQGVLFAM
jgi:hypothetical protein